MQRPPLPPRPPSPEAPDRAPRLLVAVLALALAASLLALCLVPHHKPTSSPAEDSPSWNCQTMGNHVCGPTSTTEPERTSANPETGWTCRFGV